VTATRGNSFEHLDLRIGPGGHPALKNKLVRRALAFGIYRVALVRELYGDIDPTWGPLDSAVFLTQAPRYRQTGARIRYRPPQARRLLERAGCRLGGDGVYECAGERLSLRFVTTAGLTTRERVLSLVQQQLRQVGIEVEPA
jgi:peptide/nickel transport system substrate-binding protein